MNKPEMYMSPIAECVGDFHFNGTQRFRATQVRSKKPAICGTGVPNFCDVAKICREHGECMIEEKIAKWYL